MADSETHSDKSEQTETKKVEKNHGHQRHPSGMSTGQDAGRSDHSGSTVASQVEFGDEAYLARSNSFQSMKSAASLRRSQTDRRRNTPLNEKRMKLKDNLVVRHN